MWNARLYNCTTGHAYWVTVHADSEHQADRMARRKAKKGYIVAMVTQHEQQRKLT